MSYIANRPIHPIVEHHPTSGRLMHGNSSPGMTLRQHYAGLAMQGLLANSRLMEMKKIWHSEGHRGGLATLAVHIADELIKELEKPND